MNKLIFTLVFLGSAIAASQTTIYGRNPTAPIAIYGDSTTPTALNGPTYTKIYVVFPPQTGSNNTNFAATVMTQSAIDGVTLQIPWNIIEQTTSPSQTDCTSSLPPDQCQPDTTAAGWFHTYDWSGFDNNTGTTPCAPAANTSSQWFCDFPNGSGSYKQVNFQLYGVGDSPANGITPAYVTTNTSYITATGVSVQDVVNTVNASACSGAYAGNTSIPASSTFVGSGGTITVTWVGAMSPFVNGDIIWVAGAGAGFNVTGVTGQIVSNVSYNSGTGNGSFQYGGSGTGTVHVIIPSNFTIVNSAQSWPIPYEAPYAAAWTTFLRAAIYHFNNLNHVGSGSGWNFQQTTSQIGYIRPGVARGGEAFPICTTVQPMTSPTSPSLPYSSTVWNSWYTQVNSAVQSSNPRMQIMYSINAGDPASQDATIATAEAGIAVAYSGSTGLYDGFGSQGLKQTDTAFVPSSCPQTGSPNTGNNWGCMFTDYWPGADPTTSNPTTGPLELQQIDCSNPCTLSGAGCSQGTSSDGCFQPMKPGRTGSLVTLYPFATSNHASILELYSQDALLAFDPYFCLLSGSGFTSCDLTAGHGGDDFTTSLSAATQNAFFQYVGLGNNSCTSLYTPTTPQAHATGNCDYAAAIYAAHGPH